MRKSLFVICLSLLLALPLIRVAKADQDVYMKPSYRDLAWTLLSFQGADLNEDQTLVEYASMFQCQKLQENYGNDFKWNKVKSELKQEIMRIRSYGPRNYEIIAPVFLDRYHFEKQAFPLSEKSKFLNIGLLRIYENSDLMEYCGRRYRGQAFPNNYDVYLSRPLVIDKLFVNPDKGKEFLDRLAKKGTQRVAYLRIRLHLTGFRKITGDTIKVGIFMADVTDVSAYEDSLLSIFLTQIPDVY